MPPKRACVRLHVLGQVRLENRGTHFVFATPRRTLSLLAYLLMRRPQPIEREFLAFTLWPDEDEEQARENLRRNLHLLQKSLPPPDGREPWIGVDSDGVRWNVEAGAWLDVAEFERLSAAPETRAAAVELYGGDLLEALYEEWLEPERARLRSLYLDDLFSLVREHRGRRDFAPAIAYAQRALVADPLREDVLRQLVALRYESGDGAGAIAEYRRFAERLRAELGVAPMPETTALFERIGRGESPEDAAGGAPSPDAPPYGKASEAPVPAPQPFVDRRNERAALAAFWSRAARGRGRVVFIAGPAGIGKSRLIDELALAVEAQGGRVLRGACTEPERAPYQGLVDTLRGSLALVEALTIPPIWLAALARMLPELAARRPDLPPLPPLDPERERTRLFEAFALAFAALAKARPTLVAIDDVQGAGEATASALAFVARRIGEARLAIVCAYRDDDVTRSHPLRRLRRELLDEDRADTIAPRPLDLESAAEFVEAYAAGSSPVTVRALHARSEGNPLFLRELVRESQTHPAADGVGKELPASIRDLVATRVGRLSEAARSFAEVAAVGGERFDADLVRDVSGWEEHETQDALGELLDRGIVREPRGLAHGRFAFTHQLVRAAIYDLAEPRTLARRHLRMAEILESSDGATEPGDLALHFDRGGRPERAVPYYLRAALEATGSYANDEGLRLASRGLEFASGPERIELLFARERLSARRGDRAAQRRDLDALASALPSADAARACELLARRIDFAQAIGDADAELAHIAALESAAGADSLWLGEALLAKARVLRRRSRFDDALDAAGRAFAHFEAAGATRRGAAVARTYAGTASDAGRFADAASMLARARAGADDDVARATLATAGVDLALVQHEFAIARAHCEDAIRLARAIGDCDLEAYACERFGLAQSFDASYEEARASLERALAIATEVGNPRLQSYALLDLGMLLQRWGALAESSAMLARASDLCARTRDDLNARICRLNQAYNVMMAGDLAPASAAVRTELEEARARGHRTVEAEALSTLAWCERAAGEFGPAATHLASAAELRGALRQAPHLEDLAELAAARAFSGDAAGARGSLRTLLAELAQSDAGRLASADLPHCFVAAAAAYERLGDDRAARDLEAKGRAALAERLARVSSPEVRAAYLRLPHNAGLAENGVAAG